MYNEKLKLSKIKLLDNKDNSRKLPAQKMSLQMQ